MPCDAERDVHHFFLKGQAPQFPLIRKLPTLYHTGRLDPESLTSEPEAWRKIARLCGKTYRLNKPGAVLLDMHKALASPACTTEAVHWAALEGLVKPSVLYRVEWYDDELETYCTADYESLVEAEGEAVGESPEEVWGWVGTDLLQERASAPGPVSSALVVDLVLAEYARDVLCLDGAWWNDTLDVLAHSAPRGGLFRPEEWCIVLADKEAHPSPSDPFPG